MRQLCPICTRLSIFVPGPITVSSTLPRSMVVLAPISTSSPMRQRPTWGILRGSSPFLPGTYPKPSEPSRTPAWRITRLPTTVPL